MPTPCESWPLALARTRFCATSSASPADEPPASTTARTARVNAGIERTSRFSALAAVGAFIDARAYANLLAIERQSARAVPRPDATRGGVWRRPGPALQY